MTGGISSCSLGKAWATIAPTDGELHAKLVEFAESSPYLLQLFSIEQLGERYIADAVPLLEDWIERDVDSNITEAARSALEEIRRVRGQSD